MYGFARLKIGFRVTLVVALIVLAVAPGRASRWAVAPLPHVECILPHISLLPRPDSMNDTEPYALWDEAARVPAASELRVIEGTRFSVIKPRRPEQDGYRWLHGVAIEWHKDALYACYGHNEGPENTVTEVANGQVSSDGGANWGPVFAIDHGTEEIAVSHGVMLSHNGRLHAFMGSFYGTRSRLHTRLYTLDEGSGDWQAHGVVARDGFWPCQRPAKMDNGNWIMAGLIVGRGNPAGVAISDGDDFTSWDVVALPKPEGINMWGESGVIIDGPHLVNIARYGGKAVALVSTSENYGRNWTELRESNLPMTPSKPYAGTLSTGQRYLVCTTAADCDNRRHPLTIAVSRPGEEEFCRIFAIRRAIHDGPGESAENAALAYPYAIERGGDLYIAYSNDGGRGGNQNSAELAVVPVGALSVD